MSLIITPQMTPERAQAIAQKFDLRDLPADLTLTRIRCMRRCVKVNPCD